MRSLVQGLPVNVTTTIQRYLVRFCIYGTCSSMAAQARMLEHDRAPTSNKVSQPACICVVEPTWLSSVVITRL